MWFSNKYVQRVYYPIESRTAPEAIEQNFAKRMDYGGKRIAPSAEVSPVYGICIEHYMFMVSGARNPVHVSRGKPSLDQPR